MDLSNWVVPFTYLGKNRKEVNPWGKTSTKFHFKFGNAELSVEV